MTRMIYNGQHVDAVSQIEHSLTRELRSLECTTYDKRQTWADLSCLGDLVWLRMAYIWLASRWEGTSRNHSHQSHMMEVKKSSSAIQTRRKER